MDWEAKNFIQAAWGLSHSWTSVSNQRDSGKKISGPLCVAAMPAVGICIPTGAMRAANHPSSHDANKPVDRGAGGR
jgi:hypothetical protein